MADDFLIREAAPADFDQWLMLWDHYNAFYGRSGPTALPRAITDATWARFFDPAEPMHAVIAESAGGLIGLAHFLYHRSTTALQPTCYLQDLFTSEAARGRGVASALIRRVTDEAKRAGSSRVYWQTHESNTVARKLYDELAEYSGFLVYRIAW
jgi:GNAT superfamily N-acetyltransferase